MMSLRTRVSAVSALTLAAVLASCAPEPEATSEPAAPIPPEAAAAAAETITSTDLIERIGLLAADSMRGRDTPSPELDQAARWIASEFERMGLEPAGDDGGYVQGYPIRTLVLDAAASSARLGGTALAAAEAWVPQGVSRSVSATGPLAVIAGQGTLEALGDEVSGRHVLVTGRPELAGGGNLNTALRDAGAVAIWRVDTRDDQAWQAYVTRVAGERTVRVSAESPNAPTVLVREAALRAAIEAAGLPADELLGETDAPVSIQVTDTEVALDVAVDVRQDVEAPNVVAILRGSDPVLRDEYVIYSAHMDHVGVGRPDATGDSIYNGADDDASGTATVIEVAEAMASLPRAPRRSQVFLLVSGEEKGLWGSAHYADNPTVPIENIVANLNADMVGRNWSDTIVAIGKEHSDLGATLERVNQRHPEIGMTAIDDLWPEQNFYGRSDHYNFARKGVPVLFFFNGTHAEYHRPGDHVELIDGEKTARIGRLLFYLGLEISDADQRPQWNPDSYREIVEGG